MLTDNIFISVAGVIEFSSLALFALDLATPNKFAVTFLILHNNLKREIIKKTESLKSGKPDIVT